MKTTTPIIVLFVILLLALMWLGFRAQKTEAPSYVPEQNNNVINQETGTNLEGQTSEEFGTDVGMEFPTPDSNIQKELGVESAPVEVLEDVYDSKTEQPVSFTIDGKNFAFLKDGQEAPELHVKLGDSVTVTLNSVEGFHDFVIDELGVATEKVSLGESTTVTFVANTLGEFEYYCSVGSHRANGMFGKFIVE